MKSEYLEDCPYYLNDFLTYMKVVKDRGERTIEAYYIDIRTFLRYLNIKHRTAKESDFYSIPINDTPIEWLERFSLNDAYVYLGFLAQSPYLNKKAMLIKEDPLKDLELPRINQSLPKYLTTEQSVQLLNSVDSKHKERDFCILVLFLSCGMRLSELVGIDLNDYSRENKTLRLFGKGRKERIVYLNDVCIQALDDYINNHRPQVENQAVFLSANKTRINKRRVQQIVEEQLKNAGLSNLGITTHKLRHSAATILYSAGLPLQTIQKQLGHIKAQTTEIYAKMMEDAQHEASSKMDELFKR